MLFAGLVIVLVAMCVLTIDVGRLFVCKAELQNAVDAAALGGASQLVGPVTPTVRAMRHQRGQAPGRSESAWPADSLTLADSDIAFGHYDPDTHSFTPETAGGTVDSVKVTGRRTIGSPDGPVRPVLRPHLPLELGGPGQHRLRRHQAAPLRHVRAGPLRLDVLRHPGMTTHSSPNSDGHGDYYMSS